MDAKSKKLKLGSDESFRQKTEEGTMLEEINDQLNHPDSVPGLRDMSRYPGRTIIMTDIHGCDRELELLLNKVQINPLKDRLIFLGDLFDRGRQSYEVFRRIQKMQIMFGDRLILIRGNHDQMLLNTIEDFSEMRLWSLNGGRKTVSSFKEHGDDIRSAQPMVEKMPFWFETDQFICVHAGLTSPVPEENDQVTVLWDRGVSYGEYEGKLGIGGHTPMKQVVWWMPGKNYMILREHSRLPLPEKGFICLDTGCVFGGKLSAMIIEGEEFEIRSVPGKKA